MTPEICTDVVAYMILALAGLSIFHLIVDGILAEHKD